jgi:hypothetical protein
VKRITLIALLLCSNPIFADNPDLDDQNGEGANTTLAITGGCVGGAVIGSVVPVIGNLAGCIVGGFASWWISGD